MTEQLTDGSKKRWHIDRRKGLNIDDSQKLLLTLCGCSCILLSLSSPRLKGECDDTSLCRVSEHTAGGTGGRREARDLIGFHRLQTALALEGTPSVQQTQRREDRKKECFVLFISLVTLEQGNYCCFCFVFISEKNLLNISLWCIIYSLAQDYTQTLSLFLSFINYIKWSPINVKPYNCLDLQ